MFIGFGLLTILLFWDAFAQILMCPAFASTWLVNGEALPNIFSSLKEEHTWLYVYCVRPKIAESQVLFLFREIVSKFMFRRRIYCLVKWRAAADTRQCTRTIIRLYLLGACICISHLVIYNNNILRLANKDHTIVSFIIQIPAGTGINCSIR